MNDALAVLYVLGCGLYLGWKACEKFGTPASGEAEEAKFVLSYGDLVRAVGPENAESVMAEKDTNGGRAAIKLYEQIVLELKRRSAKQTPPPAQRLEEKP